MLIEPINKRNQEMVFDDNALKDALFNADIPIIIFRLSPFGILHINKIFEKEWGIEVETLQSEPERLLDIVYAPDREEFITKVVKNPLVYCYERIEFRIVMPNGHKKWHSLNLYPLWIQKKLEGTIGFAQGIAEGKSQEVTLHTLYGKVEDYIRMVEHDLRGRVGNIGIILNLIKQKVEGRTSDKIMPYLQLMTDIYQETMSYAEGLSHKFFTTAEEFSPEETDIANMLSESIDTYRAQLEEKQLKLSVEKPEEKVLAMVDRAKFRQLFNNLLSNAIKFSHEKGDITITLKSSEKDIVIATKDTGIGIPAASQPFIFDKHSRAMRKGTRGEEPSGLGTFIIKRMVDIHQGKVWFESEEGAGTTFYVRIPKQPE